MKHHLEGNYPELRNKIEGGNYPAPQYAEIMVKVTSAVQFGTIALALMGDTIFGANPPGFVHHINENRVALLGGGFVLNSWAQTKMASGAFEIYLNGQLIFSKLKVGRLPTQEELSAAMSAHGLFPDEKFGDSDM